MSLPDVVGLFSDLSRVEIHILVGVKVHNPNFIADFCNPYIYQTLETGCNFHNPKLAIRALILIAYESSVLTLVLSNHYFYDRENEPVNFDGDRIKYMT